MSIAARAFTMGLGLVLALAAIVAAVALQAVQGGTLEVTVSYQGAGDVGPNNAVWLAVYDTPDIASDPGLLPIAGGVVTENGGTASFPGLSAGTVYVTAVYDSQGGWTGTTAVPSGSPAGVYNPTAAGAPGAVEVGSGETVEIDFQLTDFYRMP